MKENVLFFIFESQILLNLFFSSPSKDKLSYPNLIRKKKIFSKTLELRIFEKIFSFFVSILSEKRVKKIFLIFHDNLTRWVFPFSGKKIIKKKEKFWNIIKNYFIQEVKILRIDLFEISKRKNKFLFHFSTSLEFILYMNENFSPKKTQLRMVYFISQSFPKKNFLPFKYILFARKKKVIFDFFLFSKRDSYSLHYLSEKTGGIYCRQKKNLLEILFTEEIYFMLCSILLPCYLSKQFYILPLSTRQTKNNQFFRKKILCPFCLSVFSHFFSECLVCGINFLN